MIDGWGSPEAWQRAMTLEWMTRIAAVTQRKRPLLFEGQMRLAFLREGLAAAGVANFHVVLVDCDDATPARRLTLLDGDAYTTPKQEARFGFWPFVVRRRVKERTTIAWWGIGRRLNLGADEGRGALQCREHVKLAIGN
jgi:hypothetical protein